MKRYEEFIEGLQQDTEIPVEVWSKFEKTLSELPEISTQKNKVTKRWIKVAASVAAVLAFGVGFCYANPTLAAKIPIIGRIFERIEDDVTFSGNYKEKGNILTAEQENASEPVDTTYTVKDQGVEITASEIYCDGYSIFLTAKIQVEAGGLSNISAHYTSRFIGEDEETTAQGIYTDGNWSLKNGNLSGNLINSDFEGSVLDDNTYVGMIKINLDELPTNGDVLNLQLSQIGYDDLNEADSEDISASHRIEGNWSLSIPYSVDTENTREIVVNEKTEDGFGISKVFVSPYQLVVYMDIPYTTLNEDEFTKEDFEAAWAEKTKGIEDAGESPVTYEDYLKEKQYEYCEVSAFNQDGEVLLMEEIENGQGVFAAKGMDISQLQIFLGKEVGDVVAESDINVVRENAILEVDVEVK